jgi:hypothetical protein
MPSQKTIVKYFTDYRADIVLDAMFEAPIPKEEPAPPGPVRFIVQNTLGLPSVKVYYKDINGVDSQTIVESAVTLDIEFNSKVSIVRNDSVNYNIEKIELFDGEENLVKTSKSNLFDIEGIQREHTAIVTSVEILTIEDAALLLSDLQNAVYDWNTEEQSEYFIEIRTQKASYVKYFFPNQPGADQDGAIKVPVNSEGSATISLKNPNAIGIYELVVFAGNEQLGDGGVTRASFNVYRQRFYGQPDVTNIVYDRNITEADLSPLKFSFNFKLDTINSEGVDVYLGENFISNIAISEEKGEVSYSATELYNAYKTYFNETNTSYEVTFSFRPYFNGIGGKIVGKSESVTVFVQRAKYLISKQEALNTFSGAFSKLFSGGATKVNYEDKIIFEDDKHLYYSIRFDNDNSYLISNIASDTFTFSLENGKVVPTDYEIDPQSGSTRRKRKSKQRKAKSR